MGTLHGTIFDSETKRQIDAKVHILDARGSFCYPATALLKNGPGTPFFFSSGEFEVSAGRGRADILVERGTEYEPIRTTVDLPEKGVRSVDIFLKRWYEPQAQHWYPGNTHIHYDEKELRPDDRLGVDCSVEGYNVTVVSVLDRRQIPYASNKYPIGVMNEFTTSHHVLDIGEENRHYGDNSPWGFGYGHVMFLNLRNLVQPVSRGHTLAAQFDPDYPPLCFCCDEAREQGGIVIWCHNGRGMEAPIAAVMGKLDAFNLFDPFWMDPEYDIWYRLLNCGIKLPASTGTDWFVCSNNRVYVNTEGDFSYERWIKGMQSGNTFITNGPAIDLRVNDLPIGSTVESNGETVLDIETKFNSHYPVNYVEIVHNGKVIHVEGWNAGKKYSTVKYALEVQHDGWVAARLSGNHRDSFGQPIYAHTSPIYIQCGRPPLERVESAHHFLHGIEQSLGWIDNYGRYNSDSQRNEVKELFRLGREHYSDLL
jgi:hypothetical protein